MKRSASEPGLRIPSHIFLETLPAKPVTTSCKNRFFRRQETYYAMKVFIRLVNKLLVMTRWNRTAIWYFRHCRNRDNLVARVFLFSNKCFQYGRSNSFHRRKMSDWSTRDHVTLPNSKWRQYLRRLFIPVERRLIAA